MSRIKGGRECVELCDGSTWTGEGSDDSHRTLSAQETQGRGQSSHTVQMRIEAQGGQVTQPRSHPSECWSWDCSRIRAHWRLGQQKYQVTQATCPGVEIRSPGGKCGRVVWPQ